MLLRDHFLEEEEVLARLGEDRNRVTRIFRTLESEGFIEKKGNGYQIN
jgi:DNA-binding IclR family transcriptional regulator